METQTLDKLSNYFLQIEKPIIPVEKQEISAVVEEMFPTSAKGHRIMNNYSFVTKKQLDKRVESQNDYTVEGYILEDMYYRDNKSYYNVNSRWNILQSQMEGGQNITLQGRTSMGIPSQKIKLDKKRYEKLPETERTYTHHIVQRGLGIFDYQLELIPTHLYDKMVPDHVIQSAIQHKDNFDEIKILDIKLEPIVEADKFIDDPILVGTLKGFPDHLFLLDYWKENISIESIATQGNISLALDNDVLGNM